MLGQLSRKGALNLAWIDLEMTGLNPDSHVIIEIATVVTDPELMGASIALSSPGAPASGAVSPHPERTTNPAIANQTMRRFSIVFPPVIK